MGLHNLAHWVSGKIIELEYIGGGKSIIGKRNLIVPVDGSSSKVDLPTIDESETLNAKLLKAQILSEQITDVSEFKNRMKKFFRYPHLLLSCSQPLLCHQQT
jgi:hypothetical protein